VAEKLTYESPLFARYEYDFRTHKSHHLIDAQIAAIARTNNLILVTRNTADFKHFADLKLQNWFAENH
jgi:predicted nucleic acid-binding protein